MNIEQEINIKDAKLIIAMRLEKMDREELKDIIDEMSDQELREVILDKVDDDTAKTWALEIKFEDEASEKDK